MALYYTLPIYKASYKLVILLFLNSENFAREYKYSVGQQLKDEGCLLIKNIYGANKAVDKSLAIGGARENIEMIRLYVRLMQDFNQIGLKKFVEINMNIEEVSKQLASWEKYNNVSKAGKKPPESSVARAQTSERSKSHNPLAKSEESRPMNGHVAQLRQKNCAINTEVIIPLAAAGNRNNSSGSVNNAGLNGNGNYWSSTVNGTNANYLNFNSSSVNPANNNNRANGMSVRCLKDLQKQKT